VRVGRRVEIDQGGPHRSEPHRRVRGRHLAPGVPGADLVRRIGDLRDDDQVVGAEAQLGRQVRDELLGPDGRQHVVGAETGDAEPALQPVDRRLTQSDRAEHRRVARSVSGVGECRLDELGRRIDRRADG
jgi:hypothetical protein